MTVMVVIVTGAHPNWVFSFEVKFYPLDAAALREDYTRCASDNSNNNLFQSLNLSLPSCPFSCVHLVHLQLLTSVR